MLQFRPAASLLSVLLATSAGGALAAGPASPSNPVFAGESMVITGVEVGGDENSYGFMSLVTPFPGNKLGGGFVQRYTMEGLTYSYDTAGTEIDARAAGGEVALGYQGSSAAGWWGAYVGGVYRDTDLDPTDPGSDVEGSHLRLRVSAEGERNLSDRAKANLFASYTEGFNAYWVRTRVLGKPWAKCSIFVGPEVVFQGDSDYRAWAVGLVVTGFKPTAKTDLAFKLGGRKSEDEDVSPYAGVEFSVRF